MMPKIPTVIKICQKQEHHQPAAASAKSGRPHNIKVRSGIERENESLGYSRLAWRGSEEAR